MRYQLFRPSSSSSRPKHAGAMTAARDRSPDPARALSKNRYSSSPVSPRATSSKKPWTIAYVATSKDGFIADKHGGVDWLPKSSEYGDCGYNQFYKSIDAIVMGSRSYDQILTFSPWPYPGKKTFVFTSKPNRYTSNPHSVDFISASVKDFMRQLRDKNIEKLWLLGGAQLISSFNNENAIDEFIITRVPATLGEGIKLIDLDNFAQVSTIPYPGGIQQFNYLKFQMRYSYYSHIHRFMRQYLSQFEGKVAKNDFGDSDQTSQLMEEFGNVTQLLESHAEHEDKSYHPLIADKEPRLFEQMTSEHKALDEKLLDLGRLLKGTLQQDLSEEEKHSRGYQFYLNYAEYLSEYYMHLSHEEKSLMPALQKHYSDLELRKITFNTYDKMTADDLVEMLRSLFPYVNRYERQVFLDDIRESQPDKFVKVFPVILSDITDPHEQNILKGRYNYVVDVDVNNVGLKI